MSVTPMPPSPPEQAAADDVVAPRRSRKRLLVAAGVLVLAAAAGWFFLLRPSGPAEPVPGEVMALEPIQVNLAGGHYLRVGLALQLTDTAHEVDGSKALDAAIALFSGQEVADLTTPARRARLKEALVDELAERYHGDVMEVYFTEFVTQ